MPRWKRRIRRKKDIEPYKKILLTRHLSLLGQAKSVVTLNNTTREKEQSLMPSTFSGL